MNTSTLTHNRLGALAPDIAEFCARAVASLREKFPVTEVWLFGSHAYGTPGEDSDVDLLVVLPDGHGLRRPTLECYSTVSRLPGRPPMDLVAVAESEWRDELNRKFGIYGDIAEKGIRLL